MPKNKMIKKGCPMCLQQVAVASKTCRCGHNFMARKALRSPDPIIPEPEEETGDGKRTGRVKRLREKPNFYDALEFEKKTKKRQRTRNRSTGSTDGNFDQASKKEESSKSNNQPQLKRKRRGKTKVNRDDQEEKESIVSTLSPIKTMKCGVILDEINRRIGAASWRV